MRKSFLLAIFVAICLVSMGAKQPVGCGGNLSDTCLVDRDCLGGQLCTGGRCVAVRVSLPDSGPRPDTPPDATPDTPSKPKGCKATGCPSGQVCGAQDRCVAIPGSKNFCEYKIDVNGVMAKADQSLRLFDDFPHRDDSSTGLALSPDGRYLATLTQQTSGRLKLWDLKSGKLVRTFEGEKIVWHNYMQAFVHFSPDGAALYANICSQSSGGPSVLHCSEVRGWKVADGSSLDVTKRYGGKVLRLALSANGAYAATVQEYQGATTDAPNNPSLLLWKVGQSKPLKVYPLATQERPSYRKNDRCAKDSDCKVNEFCKDIGRGTRLCYVKDRPGAHAWLVTHMVVSNKGVVFSADTHGELMRWDASKSQRLEKPGAPHSFVSFALALRQDGKVLAVGRQEGSNSVLRLYDADAGTLQKEVDLRRSAPSALRFEAANRIALTFQWVAAEGLSYGAPAGWGVWHGKQMFHSERPRWDILEQLKYEAKPFRAAASADGRVRAALVRRNKAIYVDVWRCADPCQGVSCAKGTFCKFGRCVSPTAECKADQTRICYTGPQDRLNTGVCKGGTETCLEGYWRGRCHGQKVPRAEICDKQDDDCDGQVDEDCTRYCRSDSDCDNIATGQSCQQGICVSKGCKQDADCTAGYSCQQGTCAPCKPEKEVCDGKDNDCDGATDEGCSCSSTQAQDCRSKNVRCPGGGTQAKVVQICARYIPNPGNKWTRCMCSPSACKSHSDCQTQHGQSFYCVTGRCIDANGDPRPMP